ncbi:MAG: UDP-glucose/GDP-mannose dehydrogenase family protein [Thermosphaera sp.]
MKICVIGTGYVGLVTGACLADFGNEVMCVDKNLKKVAELRKGNIDFHELGLKDLVKKNVAAKRLFFTTKYQDAVLSSQVIFVAVGTPPLSHGGADLSAISDVSQKIAKVLKANKNNHSFKVIAVKSTVPVGTSEYVEKIMREKGLNPRKFAVVSNPEFLREGKAVGDFLHPDRIVIGAENNRASNIMAELYRPLNARIIFMDRRSSEMVKYASNAYLATRISLVNELANICERVGADIRKVVEGMGYDSRIGHAYLRPGIGFGGSCLPKDVSALIHLAGKSGYEALLLKSVEQVNQRQRINFANKIISLLKKNGGRTVCIWGLAFKPQTDDLRDAPSITVIKELLRRGVKIRAYDPMSNNKAKAILPGVIYCDNPYSAAKGSDVIALITEWNEFREMDFAKLKNYTKRPIIVDGRNVFEPKVFKGSGIKYFGIGIKM